MSEKKKNPFIVESIQDAWHSSNRFATIEEAAEYARKHTGANMEERGIYKLVAKTEVPAFVKEIEVKNV